jgi:hypothetical protein
MYFSRPESEDPVAPPVFHGKIDATFFRPATQFINQAGLATAGWTSDKNLAKSHTTRNGHALDPVYRFNLDTIQGHQVFPVIRISLPADSISRPALHTSRGQIDASAMSTLSEQAGVM